jgi:hypothetical protein
MHDFAVENFGKLGACDCWERRLILKWRIIEEMIE